jgi:hypothetical protein
MTTPDQQDLLRELDDLYAALLKDAGGDSALAERRFRARVAEAPHYIDALVQDSLDWTTEQEENDKRELVLLKEHERFIESRIPVQIDEDTWVAFADMTLAQRQRWLGFLFRRHLATELGEEFLKRKKENGMTKEGGA